MTVTASLEGREAGLSLVEMLVVLVVLALAASLGGPAIRTVLPGRRLDVTADAVANELNLLRAEAARTGRRTSLVYDPEAARFVSSRAAAKPLSAAALQVGIDVPPEARSGPGEIRFLPSGAGTGGRIVIADGSSQRVLTVSRITGAVHRGETVP